jgi:hypothetical protein
MSVAIAVRLRSLGPSLILMTRRRARNVESYPIVPSFKLRLSAVEADETIRTLEGWRSAKSWQSGESTQQVVAVAAKNNRPAIAAVKSGPFRNKDRASATAA